MATKSQATRYFITGLVVLIVIIMAFSAGNLFENVGAEEIKIKQAWQSGDLTVWTTAGIKWQGFGKVTDYKKASQLNCVFEDIKGTYAPLSCRFNDAGKAEMALSVRWENPLDHESMKKLHTKYNSQEAIEKNLVLQTLDRAVYMTGPLMSSRESYAERRPDLLRYIEDQAKNGVYKTKVRSTRSIDQLTGIEKTVDITEPVINTAEAGGIERQTQSPFREFNIQIVAGTLTINNMRYDDRVIAQIEAQQGATMRIQTAIAEAKEAEQKTITVAEKGKAAAAKAKWEQEVIKATQVTKAEQEKEVALISATQRKEVAMLDKEAAALTKQKEILLGEGESARKRLVLQADGALEKKLATYQAVQQFWADAWAKNGASIVPNLVMGGGADGQMTQGADPLTNYLRIMAAKAAQDLSLDMSVPTGAKAKKN